MRGQLQVSLEKYRQSFPLPRYTNSIRPEVLQTLVQAPKRRCVTLRQRGAAAVPVDESVESEAIRPG